jgi:hypothetical protein
MMSLLYGIKLSEFSREYIDMDHDLKVKAVHHLSNAITIYEKLRDEKQIAG